MSQTTNSTITQGMFRQSENIYQRYWPNLYCACAKTAISELLVKIVTPPLDSATPTLVSHMVRIFWRSVGIYHVAMTFDPMILNICSVSAVTWSKSLLIFSAKSNNPRLSYCNSKIENLWSFAILFHRKWISTLQRSYMSRNAPTYQIAAQSSKAWLSYWWLSEFYQLVCGGGSSSQCWVIRVGLKELYQTWKRYIGSRS